MKKFLLIPAIVWMIAAKAQSIGENYQGGIVFYKNEVKKYVLIASPADNSRKTRWGNNGKLDVSAIDDGRENVTKLKATDSFYDFSAFVVCDTSERAGYTDWYLPAINELTRMHEMAENFGNFAQYDYCSSTEFDKGNCWAVHFMPHNKVKFFYNKTSRDYNVRCIRRVQYE